MMQVDSGGANAAPMSQSPLQSLSMTILFPLAAAVEHRMDFSWLAKPKHTVLCTILVWADCQSYAPNLKRPHY